VPRRLHWLLRMLAVHLLPTWCCLVFFAGSASAMAPDGLLQHGDEPAPMCDPDGASVVAADDIPEVDRGHFETLPCEAQLLLAGWRLDAPELGRKAVSVRDAEQPSPAQHAAPSRLRSEGARTAIAVFPSRSEPMLGVFAAAAGLAPSRGHLRTLFRPPVARA
jgi:hypothetical protein